MRELVLVSLIFIATTDASAQDAESGFRAGPTMAVQGANLKDGIRLTEKAKEVIGIKTEKLSAGSFSAPKSALVYFGDKVGVYRFRDGWFKLIEIRVVSKKEESVSLTSTELKDGDQIVITGVALLRVSEMDAFGGEE